MFLTITISKSNDRSTRRPDSSNIRLSLSQQMMVMRTMQDISEASYISRAPWRGLPWPFCSFQWHHTHHIHRSSRTSTVNTGKTLLNRLSWKPSDAFQCDQWAAGTFYHTQSSDRDSISRKGKVSITANISCSGQHLVDEWLSQEPCSMYSIRCWWLQKSSAVLYFKRYASHRLPSMEREPYLLWQ